MAPYDCGLRGNVVFTYCALDGNGVVTVGPLPKPCERPENLSQVDFAIGYTITSINLVVDSTISQVDACNAITYLNTFPPNTVVNNIIGSYENLSLGSIIYAGPKSETDCSVIPNGWYFTNESSTTGTVYEVVSGVIVSIQQCTTPTSTTTTSTTACSGTHLHNYNFIFSTTTYSDFTLSFANACLAAACLQAATCGPSSLLIGWWDNGDPVIGDTVYNATSGCVVPNVDGYYVIYLSGVYKVIQMLDGVVIAFPTC